MVVLEAAYNPVDYGEAHAEHGPGVADSHSPDEGTGDFPERPRVPSVLAVVGWGEELAAAVPAEIVLFTVAFLAVLLYIFAVAVGAGDFYFNGQVLHSITFPLSAYFL